ncbi:L,D-transpeptidase family protein [Prosthecomicrobium sp. N25]|uniref:L,D-transpeptidase family protein n=1 Tax=Prosthecomicrobium sp. N25 TaxID=3129254 RepID=UPI0030787059
MSRLGTLLLVLVALLAGVPGRADAQVRPTFEAGDTALVSPETERGLVAAIEAYRAIVAAGGWPTIVSARGLKPNDNDAAVATLRRRLAITGDLPAATTSTFYDAALRDAVVRYQMRHGLRPNGVASGLTLAHMNVSAGERLQQLVGNLERLRASLAKVPRTKYVVVNIPDFELQGVSGGRVELVTRVIVGKRTTPTPEVVAAVQAVDLLPYWHVPSSIAYRDLVPTIRKDPGYLASKKIRVYSSYGGGEVDPSEVNWFGEDLQRYTFRQDPGPQNALGLIRLDMPNRHIVYMHDTPMKDLFGQDERSFSAGCVRVQSVADVAAWLIGDGTTGQSLLDAAATGQKTTIKIARPVPVHFVYLTAWVSDGVVQFRNDLYNRDAPPMPEDATAAAVKAPFQSLAP